MTDDELLLKSRIFNVVRRISVTADGQRHTREIIRHPGAVVLLPLLDDGRVVLIRNFRISVGKQLVELPAGTLGIGEDPAAAAARELAEETGYRARKIELLTSFLSSPGILDEKMYLYLASGLEAGPTALEPGEEIQSLVVPWAEAMQMARDGRISDAKTLVGLLYYERFGSSAR